MTVKFQLNHAGVRELLRSKEVQAELTRRARKIANRAGVGHEVEEFTGKNRGRSTVRTVSIAAEVAEFNFKNLTNAIEAGRD